jgi:hypothetical protein
VVPLVLVTGGGTALWWHGQQNRPVLDGCTNTVRLRVSAAPEIAPVVQRAARALDPGTPGCPSVGVTAQEPATTAGDTTGGDPDVWIPSSSLWLRIANAQASRFAADSRPLARSPIVFALPEVAAQSVWGDKPVTWAGIADKITRRQLSTVSMPDPVHDTVGLLSMLGVQSATARAAGDPGVAQLRALAVRSRLTDAGADPDELLERYAAETEPGAAASEFGAFTVTEQQLRAYQRGGHKVALVGRQPTDAAVAADYPLAVAAGAAADPDRQRLVDRLTAELRSPQTDRALIDAGFRLPDELRLGTVPDVASGVRPTPLALPDDPERLRQAATQWSRYQRRPFQVLLLVDVSGSMNDPVRDRSGRTTTKAELLRRSGLNAAQVFSEDTSVGLWYFGTPTPTSPAYQEAVPFGPLTGQVGRVSRRDLLAGRINGYRAAEQAGTPLYKTILDGAEAMRARLRPDTVTLVVVLTDGDDEDSRWAMSREAFLSRLTGGRAAGRPVPVFGVGFGPDADMATLQAAARATGGQATAATDPADLAAAMARVFLAAHAAG